MKNKWDRALFLLAMFLIKLPPFYLSPLTTKLLTTHVLAKLILGGIFLYFIADAKIRAKLNNKVLIFPLLFFLSQSLSLIAAKDTYLFLKDYQNVLFALCIFLGGFMYAQKKEKTTAIYHFILFVGIVTLLLDLIYFLFSSQFISFVTNFIQKEMLPVYIINLERGRYNLYLNSELFLSFFISAFLIAKQKRNKLLLFGAIFFSIFLTFLSNFRHRFLFLIFILLSYGVLIIRKKDIVVKKIALSILGIFVLGMLSSLLITRLFFQHDIIDRLLLSDEIEDVRTINTRVDRFNKSIELMESSPLFGVGLGNYQLYNQNSNSFSIVDPIQRQFAVESSNDPHSIVSKTMGETGLFGLIALSIMILSFLRKDLLYISKEPSFETYAYIVAFWGMFLLSLITPSITIFRGGWMWFMRGVLEGVYERG